MAVHQFFTNHPTRLHQSRTELFTILPVILKRLRASQRKTIHAKAVVSMKPEKNNRFFQGRANDGRKLFEGNGADNTIVGVMIMIK